MAAEQAARDAALFSHVDASPYELDDSLESELLSPSLVVHMPMVRRNVRTMVALCGGPNRWRPHLKTTKLPAVWLELASAGVTHFKVATTREASVLCAALHEFQQGSRRGGGRWDVLVAHHPVGPNLQRLAAVQEAWPNVRLSTLAEDGMGAASVPAPLGVFVDVNVGMDRTGCPAADAGRAMSAFRNAGGRFRGVHAYEGHLTSGTAEERAASASQSYEQAAALMRQMAAEAGPEAAASWEMVTSGTPALLCGLGWDWEGALPAGAAHRVGAGTVVFHDMSGEAQNPGMGLVPAATVFARVVSAPREGRVTLDAGSKALAAEAGHPAACVLGRPGLVMRPLSEEHAPCDGAKDGGAGHPGPPGRGVGVHLVPRHVCPTVNLAERAVLVEGPGEPYRVVAVQARAHDVLRSEPLQGLQHEA